MRKGNGLKNTDVEEGSLHALKDVSERVSDSTKMPRETSVDMHGNFTDESCYSCFCPDKDS